MLVKLHGHQGQFFQVDMGFHGQFRGENLSISKIGLMFEVGVVKQTIRRAIEKNKFVSLLWRCVMAHPS